MPFRVDVSSVGGHVVITRPAKGSAPVRDGGEAGKPVSLPRTPRN